MTHAEFNRQKTKKKIKFVYSSHKIQLEIQHKYTDYYWEQHISNQHNLFLNPSISLKKLIF